MAGTPAIGSNVSDTPLQIGLVTFTKDEAPAALPIGAAKQMLVVHQLIGGGRVTQSFGVDPEDVTWRGALYDQNVAPRITLLRSYAVDGKEYVLSFLSEKYYCVVRSFVPTYHNQWFADYEITVTITRDANGAMTSSSPTNLDAQNQSLLGNASTANQQLITADPTGTAAFQTQMAAIRQGVQYTGPIAQASPTQATTLLQTIQTGIASVNTYLQTLGQFAPGQIPGQQLISALQCIADNVTQGQAPRTIQVQGGNLFQIATQYYGDPSLAFQLAAVNGIVSPFLPNGILNTITLPPFPVKARTS